MSSDGYFDDEMDSAFLIEVDAIEAAHSAPRPTIPPPTNINVLDDSDDDFGMSMDFDDAELQKLDVFIEDSLNGKAAPVPGPSNLKQMTLWGQAPPAPSITKPLSKSLSRTAATPFGKPSRKTKEWDRTAFAKSGWKKPKDKGKGKAIGDEEEEVGEEEEVEFEQFPAPFVSIGPPPPMKLTADRLATEHWIYPLNQEKRDYQFNIVKRCLFDNTLVALPTGLGKTFIAGVVMLNYYRWFPAGKVVFVAPTKPLVAQQIDACHRSCGIPGSDAAELTGEVSKALRHRAWEEKRVFYMTPQTLINDLSKENCDPTSIVLLVVDEAHKGRGDYAYAQVVRFMMAKNPHFRLLALTATPGSNPPAVQEIVDSLHISHIEIRDEESLDLRPYMFKKNLELHIIPMDEEIIKVRELLVKVMEPMSNQIRSTGLLKGNPDVRMLHPFSCTRVAQELRGSKNMAWMGNTASLLAALARCMSYLIEASVGMCYDALKSVVEGDSPETTATKSATAKKAKKNPKLGSNPAYQDIMKQLESQKSSPKGFPPHPKMTKLKMLVIQHFASRTSEPSMPDAPAQDVDAENTRVMVFVTFRNCLQEIVEYLNEESPLIRATKFIGQGADKEGGKGFSQKEQLDVIRRFKAGEFNVMVSTSIGEEGLDIGEIDLIVCYDAQKTPIRMLQRVGRTGRKREGYVHVLLGEGREENNWSKAQESYQEVQHSIVRGDQLELYADVERLIPDDVKPECKEMRMEIEEYVRGKAKEKASAKSKSTAATKRKRDDDVGRNIPEQATLGFVSARDLVPKKKRKKNELALEELDERVLESDEDDRDIEAGIHGPRRTASAAASTSVKSKIKKSSLKRAATTMAVPKRKAKARSKKTAEPLPEKVYDLTSSQIERMGMDDSDDMEIERGLKSSPPPPIRSKPASSNFSSAQTEDFIEISSPNREMILDSPRVLSRSVSTGRSSNYVGKNGTIESSVKTPSPSPQRSIPRTPSSGKGEAEDVSWLVDDDEGPNVTIEIVSSSPDAGDRRSRMPLLPMDEDDEVEFFSPQFSGPKKSRRRASPSDIEVEFVEAGSSKRASSPDILSSPALQPSKPSRNKMPPPPVPSRLAPIIELPPEPSFPVRLPRKQGPKRAAVPIIVNSSPLAMPPPSQRRIQRHKSSSPGSPPSPALPTRRANGGGRIRREWVANEAVHSGDEISVGSSGEDDPESESDRQFLKDIPNTQVSPSYNQTAAYRQSLMSQAPVGARAPAFSRAPVRNRPFGPDRGRRVVGQSVSSSPPREEGEEPDEYITGSFVVDDDAEVSYLSSSEA